ncbi:MAG TPA: DUF1428 family protein [Candidatus Nitrosopolaris rasttigaisensis]|nr:DUF1428 family protein [Candidatus Nitrosopolaris rasttigaisensis]
MNKSDATEEEKEIESQIQLIVGRVPKKNHDAALQIYKQSSDLFRRYGLLRSELFQLNNTKTYDEMGLTNIANTVSARQDEEVWVELQYYRNRKHLDQVRAKCGNDENMGRLYKQSLALLTPGSTFMFGEFDRLSV